MAAKTQAESLPIKVGKVRVTDRSGKLTIRFSLDYKDYQISKLGDTTPENIKLAIAKAQQIDSDIALQCFDASLVKYTDVTRHSKNESFNESLISTPNTDDIDLLDLWAKFIDYKKQNGAKAKTLFQYDRLTALLTKININSLGLNALAVKSALLLATTSDQTRRALMYLSALCDFGMRFKLLTSNPFKGMSADMPAPNYATNPTPNAFSEDEMHLVIQAFNNSVYYYGYTSLVKFWFMTGCRPSEAIGLRWMDIADDFSTIKFDGSIQCIQGRFVREKGSKNNKSRLFPCNADLQAMLKALKPIGAMPDNLAFTSPRGGTINYPNFEKRAWSIVDDIKPDTTPYSCRDTFISLQLLKGTPSAVIAKWCDTSTTMIDKYYTDATKFLSVLPK